MSSTISGTPCYGWQLTDVMTRIVNRFNQILAYDGSTATWETWPLWEWGVLFPDSGTVYIGYTPSSSAADTALIGYQPIELIRDGLEELFLVGYTEAGIWPALPTDWTTASPTALLGSTTSVYYRAIGSSWTGANTWLHSYLPRADYPYVYDVDYLELTACLGWMEMSTRA